MRQFPTRREREADETPAEVLIALAELVRSDKGEVDRWEGLGDPPTTFAQVRLGLEFTRLPKGKQLKAIVEKWDLQRIVREVY